MSILLLSELSAAKSFGISYLSPFNGEHFRDMFTDGLFRLPLTLMGKRTSHVHPRDRTGEVPSVNPVPHPQLEKAQKHKPQSEGRRP